MIRQHIIPMGLGMASGILCVEMGLGLSLALPLGFLTAAIVSFFMVLHESSDAE